MEKITRKTLSRTAMLKRAGTDTTRVIMSRRIPLAARITLKTRNTRKTRTIRSKVGETDKEIKLSKMKPENNKKLF